MQPLASDDPAEIGRYRLRARLGAGGMGRVYLASTPAGRPVALKVVRPELADDQEFRARFRREIEAARRVHGLYTAELLDADPAATLPWLVTAYVPGPSLQEAVSGQGPMPEATVFRLVAGVAEALQVIHSAGLVHRDLKPSNVVLGPDGPRVIDFGIARAMESTALTRHGMTVGTVHFMAPEQILDLPVTPMIDIFALGSLAVYAALGRPPFGNGHPAAVSHRVIYEPADVAGCPPRLRDLAEACLAKQPGDRPSLGRILEFCLDHAAVAAGSWPPGAAGGAAVPDPQAPSWPVTGALLPGPGMPVAGSGPAVTQAARLLPPQAGPPPQAPPRVMPAAGGAPRRPVPPLPVINAVRLIFLGALLSLGGALAAALAYAGGNGPAGPPASGPATVTLGVLATGAWLWTAWRIRRGLRGSRIIAAVFFAVNVAGVLGGRAAGLATHLSFVFGLAEWGTGLAAILFLWDRRSGVYFAGLRRARRLATPQWPKQARPWGGGRRAAS